MEGREVLDLLNRAKGGDTTAIDDLRQKADTGDPVAQTGLATAYLAGIGVAKDDAEAARLTRLAADQGFPPAEYDLALLILPAVAFQRTSASRQNGWRKRRPARVAPAEQHRIVVRGWARRAERHEEGRVLLSQGGDQASPKRKIIWRIVCEWRGRQEEPERGEEVVRQGGGAGASRRAAQHRDVTATNEAQVAYPLYQPRS